MANYHIYSIKNSISIDNIILIYRKNLNSGFTDFTESHNFWEFIFVEQGEVSERCDDKFVHLKAGEVLFHKPNEVHETHLLSQNGAVAVYCSFSCNDSSIDILQDIKIKLPAYMKTTFNNVINEFYNNFNVIENNPVNQQDPLFSIIPLSDTQFGSEQVYRMYLEIFLIQTIRLLVLNDKVSVYSDKKEFYEQLTNSMKEIMSNNLYAKFSINDLCRDLHYSRTFLCNLFSRQTGDSIMHYYNSLKIDEAVKLLKTTDYTSVHISNILNFSSPYYFSKVFKSFTGLTPAEYRKQNR